MTEKPKQIRSGKYKKITIDKAIYADIIMLYDLHEGFKIRLIEFLNKENKDYLQKNS